MERLTNKEEEIMQALWQLEKAFVKEILEELGGEQHYNTISTIVRNLEEKGYIGHKAFGKTHQYYPLVSKEDYTKRFRTWLCSDTLTTTTRAWSLFLPGKKKSVPRSLERFSN